ncbi:MAG: tetratricopeptide repeat protein, partial [Planctomycetes bacterium]|nr:tetratricopeptide repeat protein [Planctomycetota bacterium]
ERDDGNAARASRQFGTTVPYTLNPSSYEPERNLLLRNDGAGTFEEVATDLGVENLRGRSLGALWHDLDADGWLDLYVANDVSDNVFFHNGGGRFTDVSHPAWVADYRGAMGLATGDYDRDGDDDIFITHWIAQENALYDSLLEDMKRLGDAPPPADGGHGDDDNGPPAPVRFVDSGSVKGLGQIAVQRVGWGCEFADFDADGWPDLAVANGSTFESDDAARGLKPQRSFLFWNREGSYFHDLSEHCDAMADARVTRGLAVSDYDRDGDQDVLFVHRDGAVQLLRNDMQQGRWIALRLRSRGADGRPIGFGDGATVVAHVGDVVLRRTVASASYLSQSSRTVHIGLGDATRVDRIEVRWVGGGSDEYRDVDAGACWELTEGEAEPRRLWSGERAASAGSITGTPGPLAHRAGAPASLDEKQRIRRFWSKQRAAMKAMKVDGDLVAATALFREALELDPDHLDSRYYLANCLHALGDTDTAIAQLDQLAVLDPRSHRTYKRLGTLEAMRARSPEEYGEAFAHLQRALDINKEETGVLLAMSEIELMVGAREDARRRLELVCRTNPRAVNAFYLRAYLAHRAGDAAGSRGLLAAARAARGEDWKPAGTTAEGDVARSMHTDETLLANLCEQWDGNEDPERAFDALHSFVTGKRQDP